MDPPAANGDEKLETILKKTQPMGPAMSINRNNLPDGYVLPQIIDGKETLGVMQTTVQDGDKEPSFKVKFRDDTSDIIPLSKMEKIPAKSEETASE